MHKHWKKPANRAVFARCVRALRCLSWWCANEQCIAPPTCLPRCDTITPACAPTLARACKLQGAAAFGVLVGGLADPLKLKPLDLLGIDTEFSLPLANPMLTPLALTEQLGAQDNSTGRLAAVDALSHPTLVATSDSRLLLFFAAHACGRDRWGIAAAESPDGSGLSWRGLGMVAEDAAVDLHAPSLFQHDGQVRRPRRSFLCRRPDSISASGPAHSWAALLQWLC